MKKIISLFFVFIISFSFSGCNKSEEKSLYTISAVISENKLTCNMELNYVNNTSGAVERLYFTLYPNAFREDAKIKPVSLNNYADAYENGVSYGGIEITSVKDDENNLNYTIGGVDKNTLIVNLNKSVKEKGKAKVNIDFTVTIPNVLHRFGYGKNTINLCNFYPKLCSEYNGKIYESVYYSSGDPFYSEVADYKVTLKVDSCYTVASSLKPTKTVVLGEQTEYSYERDSVRGIAFIMSKDFNILKTDYNGISISYYYFNDENPKKTLGVVKDTLAFYSEKFCPYPYSEYVVCEADFIYGGMEYPCLTYINANLVGYERDYVIAHETAHEWWYGLVGVNESEEGFIDEGLTEFSTSLYISSKSEYNKSLESILSETINVYKDLREIALLSGTEKTPTMKRNLNDFKSDLDYVSIAYYRSQIMFYKLYEYMGAKKFNEFLKSILNNYSYKNITYENLKSLAENKKKGSKDFLDGYVLGITAI